MAALAQQPPLPPPYSENIQRILDNANDIVTAADVGLMHSGPNLKVTTKMLNDIQEHHTGWALEAKHYKAIYVRHSTSDHYPRGPWSGERSPPGTWPSLDEPRYLKAFPRRTGGKHYYYLAKASAREMAELRESRKERLEEAAKRRREKKEERDGGGADASGNANAKRPHLPI
eukprot:TRINITY_DN85689_c0_g1_i1.p1 TRINITY_DN85689_c0_g1~~TRINITY_DN85689_c0_g1_i1.p1  ORF type:complete len:187 (-),score=12.76 TRINITY_DN85689_c0_g1_i1:234-752(-)